MGSLRSLLQERKSSLTIVPIREVNRNQGFPIKITWVERGDTIIEIIGKAPPRGYPRNFRYHQIHLTKSFRLARLKRSSKKSWAILRLRPTVNILR